METVPESIQRLLENLKQPAYVTGRRWDLLACNAIADDVFAFSRLPADERNIMLCMFTNRQTQPLFGVRRGVGGGSQAHGGAVSRDARHVG